jgi:hypothetical protein
MANTFELISAVTVGSGGAASIDFTSIPATYTDLVVKYSLRADADTGYAYVRFNSDSGSNYKWMRLVGDTAASSASSASATYIQLAASMENSIYTSSTFSNGELYVPNYAGATQKSVSDDAVNETNAAGAFRGLIAGLWTGTAAIASLSLVSVSGNLVQYSTAYLYGVKNA